MTNSDLILGRISLYGHCSAHSQQSQPIFRLSPLSLLCPTVLQLKVGCVNFCEGQGTGAEIEKAFMTSGANVQNLGQGSKFVTAHGAALRTSVLGLF